jgi:hypothetical protein
VAGPALLAVPLTVDEAAQQVMDQVVGANPDEVIVMSWPMLITPADAFGPYTPQTETVDTFLSIRRDSWFFWIDDRPGAQFSHPSRFVLVERDTGVISVTNHEWWPVLNGATLWPGDGDWEPADRVFGNVTEPSLMSRAFAVASLAQASTGHFVGVNTWRCSETHEGSFEADIENMLDLWGTALGFNTSWFADPTNYGSANGPPSTEAVCAEIERIAGQTTGPVVIFITGHGRNLQDGSTHVGRFHEDLLYDKLKLFDKARDVSVILNGCHTGGMLEGDKGKLCADVVITATDFAGESQGDVDGEYNGSPDANPNDTGSEFVSSVVLGILETSQQNPGALPSELINKGWSTILGLDQAFLGGFSHPQIRTQPSDAAMTIGPPLLEFTHMVGVTECPQKVDTYTITNSGDINLDVTVEAPQHLGAKIEPKPPIPTTDTTATLAPGESVTVCVEFLCTTTSSFEAQINNRFKAADNTEGNLIVLVIGTVQ